MNLAGRFAPNAGSLVAALTLGLASQLVPGQCEDSLLVPHERGHNLDFGASADVDGDRLVIGANGAAYVFRAREGGWQEEARLTPSDPGENRFGTSVAIHDDVIAVGAHWSDHEGVNDVGAVYMFRYVDGAWEEEQKLVPSEPDLRAFLGERLVLQSGMLMAGASGDRNRNGGDAGSVYYFRYNGQRWIEWQKIEEPNVQHHAAGFGWRLAEYGDWMAIFSFSQQEEKVLMYNFDGITWEYRQTIQDPYIGEFGTFGIGLSMYGGTLAILDSQERISEHQRGAVYMYRLRDEQWVPDGTLTPIGDPGSIALGTPALVNEDRIVSVILASQYVGASEFAFEDNQWKQTRRLLPGDGDVKGSFGSSIVVAEQDVLIGASDAEIEGVSVGKVYSFPLAHEQCTGRERLSIRCQLKRHRTFKLVVSLKRSVPTSTVRLLLDGDPEALDAVNVGCNGEARRVFKRRMNPGAHELRLLECGDTAVFECG